mmetsp:Transcript_57109/g.177535  ORF Transcript_57109/g.177535 Transcript_57109/m.177535 type:complete len:307 (-) Transcript_57109:322-1242(-)
MVRCATVACPMDTSDRACCASSGMAVLLPASGCQHEAQLPGRRRERRRAGAAGGHERRALGEGPPGPARRPGPGAVRARLLLLRRRQQQRGLLQHPEVRGAEQRQRCQQPCHPRRRGAREEILEEGLEAPEHLLRPGPVLRRQLRRVGAGRPGEAQEDLGLASGAGLLAIEAAKAWPLLRRLRTVRACSAVRSRRRRGAPAPGEELDAADQAKCGPCPLQHDPSDRRVHGAADVVHAHLKLAAGQEAAVLRAHQHVDLQEHAVGAQVCPERCQAGAQAARLVGQVAAVHDARGVGAVRAAAVAARG